MWKIQAQLPLEIRNSLLYKLNHPIDYQLAGKSRTLTMYIAEIPNFPSFSVFRGSKKQSVPNRFDLISRCFDETLIRRLKALDPPSISLSWLSRAVDFLSLTHADAKSLISNLKLSSLEDDSLARYLDDSVKILDLCNSISSHIEKLRQGRLLVNFFLHLVGSSDSASPEKLRRARDSLAEWEISSSGTKRLSFQSSLAVLIRDLAVGLGSAPRGKISSVGRLIHRTIYAVELLTVFVAGAVASALHGSPALEAVRSPAEFAWAGAFNDLESAFSAELKRRFAAEEKRRVAFEEWVEVETRTKNVCDVMDDAGLEEDEKRERLNGAVKELENATEALTKGLDGLVDGVNGMFRTVLCTRNDMLANFRVGQK